MKEKSIPGQLSMSAMGALMGITQEAGAMTYARRTDENQSQIVKDLTRAGFSVMPIHRIGDDCPDLVVGRAGVDRLVEVKRPLGPRGGSSHSHLTDGQKEFARYWQGAPVIVARSAQDVIDAFEAHT